MADVRRIRRKKHTAVVPEASREKAQKLALKIEEMEDEVAELQFRIQTRRKALFTHMRNHGIDNVRATNGDFKVETPSGRSQTEVHVEELYNRLSDDLPAFFECVKGQVAQVKKHFGEKEIAEFTTTTPGKKGEPRLVYKGDKK